MAENLSSLSRQVNRIDERLVDVERNLSGFKQSTELNFASIKQNTDLIPGIAEAVQSHTSDLDNHENRLKSLEEAATS